MIRFLPPLNGSLAEAIGAVSIQRALVDGNKVVVPIAYAEGHWTFHVAHEGESLRARDAARSVELWSVGHDNPVALEDVEAMARAWLRGECASPQAVEYRVRVRTHGGHRRLSVRATEPAIDLRLAVRVVGEVEYPRAALEAMAAALFARRASELRRNALDT